jgi:hypothetical protein
MLAFFLSMLSCILESSPPGLTRNLSTSNCQDYAALQYLLIYQLSQST